MTIAWEAESLGDGAVRVRLPAGTDLRAVLAALRATPNVVDAVVTEAFAAAYFDAPPRPDAVVAAIAAAARGGPSRSAREHVVPVLYDGADLDEVAALAELTPRRVVELHTAPRYEVRFLGFAPGFAYLRGLDPRLLVSRRSTPRKRVPAGAVAIAGPYSAVYPFETAGGWRLLGHTVRSVFNEGSGALLAPGDGVRFVVAP